VDWPGVEIDALRFEVWEGFWHGGIRARRYFDAGRSGTLAVGH